VIPQSFIQELLARIDIVEVVGRTVKLRKAGANFLGLCPFHGEKSPSFTVSPTKQFYHCFGCGVHGSAVGFLMEQAGLGYVDAIHELARSAGLTVPQESSPGDAVRRDPDLLETLAAAAKFYKSRLREASAAIDYLKGRGVSGETAARYGIGYAPDGWRGLEAAVPDYSAQALVATGLVIESEPEPDTDGADSPGAGGAREGSRRRRYDRFRDRIMFPIRNPRGQVIGFGGRVMGKGEPKYLNSPETALFSKGRELYGLFEARDAIRAADCVIVVEGYMDVVMLAQHGVGNAVATLGTATTALHAQKLLRLVDRVVFAFDGDAAGRRAAWRALEGCLPHAGDTKRIDFLFLPAEHDPDSYIREKGSEAFSTCVATATPLSKFLIEVASEACDLQSAEGRAHLSSNASPLWRALPDGALKRQLLSELAQLIQLEASELAGLWLQQAEAAASRSSPRNAVSSGGNFQAGLGNGASGMPNNLSGVPYDPEGMTSPFEPARNSNFQKKTRARPDGKTWQQDPQGKWRLVGGSDSMQMASLGPRVQPANRSDHAVRLILTNMALWDGLSAEDHALLCDLPEQHGEIMRWIESQFHDHGPLAWGALQSELSQLAIANLAEKLMRSHKPNLPEASLEAEPGEARKELRLLLNLMLIDRLKGLETQALKEAETIQSPEAFQKWRDLHQRRRTLMSAEII
jgi:DNA primase